ncbi:MAG: PhoH family protein [Bacteroidales bacterium]|nr:PhoH family protein [Bacteroidales bacterium]MDD4671174.1 PhoH family protein [Bacteroidales bacterium]
MIEKKIILEEIDPLDIYGVNNKLFNMLKNRFPKIKAVARGSEILLEGPPDELVLFEDKINALVHKRKVKSVLTEYDIDELFENNDRSAEIGKVEMPNNEDYIIVYGNDGRVIKARTPHQKRLVKDYYQNDLIFAIGPAGTGKTYTAIALAVRALKNREVKRLILTRPAVEAGERLGFLPGDLKEKLDPYLQPLYDALGDMIPAKRLQMLMEDGIIQIAPLAYMRGRTLDRAFVILDEAQNTSLGQLKMFLTRMGSDAKFIVTGDATQIDLPNKRDSGLVRGVEILKDIRGISIIEFGKEDIVRHPLVTKIVDAFEKEE